MIGRAAEYKYEKKKWPLQQKCFHMVELLLKKEGMSTFMSYHEFEAQKEKLAEELKKQIEQEEKDVGLRVGRDNEQSKLTTKKVDQDDGLEEDEGPP